MILSSKLFIFIALSLCLLGIASSVKISSTTARSYEKIAILALVLVGSGMIVFSEATTSIANLIGIGRGSDLVLYLFMLSMMYVVARIYAELKLLNSRISKLALHVALMTCGNNH